jgi:hypothetical protein
LYYADVTAIVVEKEGRMAKTKVKIAFDAKVARELRRVAGPRGVSRLVNAAVRRHLQGIRLREAEAELAAKYGPISEEAERFVAAFDWPR